MRKALGSVAAVLFWLLVWQLAAALANRTLLLPLPTPVDTAAALWRMASQPDFWRILAASVLRICGGFAAALALGVLCAAASARRRLFRRLTAPLVQLIRAIPVAVFTIVVFLWVSRPYIPSVIVFFTVLPVVWSNVETGLCQTDRRLCEMAQVFGMPRSALLRQITLPAIRPYLTAAVTSGLGFAWKSGIAAEVICRTRGSLGDLLWSSKAAVSYDEVFALTVVIVVCSSLLQRAAAPRRKEAA